MNTRTEPSAFTGNTDSSRSERGQKNNGHETKLPFPGTMVVTVVLLALGLWLFSTISAHLQKTRKAVRWVSKGQWKIDVLRDHWRVIEHLPGIGREKALFVKQLRKQTGESDCSWMRNLPQFMQRLKIPARLEPELEYQGRWLKTHRSPEGDRH